MPTAGKKAGVHVDAEVSSSSDHPQLVLETSHCTLLLYACFFVHMHPDTSGPLTLFRSDLLVLQQAVNSDTQTLTELVLECQKKKKKKNSYKIYKSQYCSDITAKWKQINVVSTFCKLNNFLFFSVTAAGKLFFNINFIKLKRI